MDPRTWWCLASGNDDKEFKKGTNLLRQYTHSFLTPNSLLSPQKEDMEILIIGGTRFVGRHLVEAALARSHTVTLFNRGQSNPDLFPELETIIGDREKDLNRLAGRQWDAVIDTSGYVPRVVRLSAEALQESVRRYVFISTISVYADFNQVGIDEDYPLEPIADETTEDVTAHYGALKVLCEQVAEAVFPGRNLIIRPHVVVGPHDPTDRFTYWPARVARGGDVLAPPGPQEPCQFIDARDLAEWTIHLMETETTGTFNAAGPAEGYTFGELLETCREVTGSDARFHWAPLDFLAAHNVAAWQELPLWFPPEVGPGTARVSIARARAAGLTLRPVAETARDTLAWEQSLPANREWRVGLAPGKEAELVKALANNQSRAHHSLP
jgi:2'-hydroxyisoflavone reductase